MKMTYIMVIFQYFYNLMQCMCIALFFFSTKTYAVGTQKNCPFEHPKHVLKLVGKKIITIYSLKLFCVVLSGMGLMIHVMYM